MRVRKKSDKRREKRRLKPVEWASPTRQQLHSSGILRRNISSQSWVNVHFYFKSWIILSYFQLLIWQVNNFQIVYCIVNYGVVLLLGVVSLMSTAREICIKGKTAEKRWQKSIKWASPTRQQLHSSSYNSLQLRVNILYCYVEFCINLYFFLCDNMSLSRYYWILSS